MKKTTPNTIFKKWMDSIPNGEYLAKQEALAEFCGVSISVVKFWKNNKTQIKPAYQKLINEFAGKKIF